MISKNKNSKFKLITKDWTFLSLFVTKNMWELIMLRELLIILGKKCKYTVSVKEI